MIAYISDFMNLAALNKCGLPRMVDNGAPNGLASIDHIQARLVELQAPLRQFLQQLTHNSRVLGGSLTQSKYHFMAEPVDSDRHNQIVSLEDRAVDHHHINRQLSQ